MLASSGSTSGIFIVGILRNSRPLVGEPGLQNKACGNAVNQTLALIIARPLRLLPCIERGEALIHRKPGLAETHVQTLAELARTLCHIEFAAVNVHRHTH